MTDDDRLSELEERLRAAEIERGERSPVPDDPTELPHSASEYYFRNLEHVSPESDESYPYAWAKYVALAEQQDTDGKPIRERMQMGNPDGRTPAPETETDDLAESEPGGE